MIVPFRRSGRRALAALLTAALVAACGSPPPPATITVEGVVRHAIVGPLAGVIVHLAGTTTTTDAAGGFRVEGVRTPYDVTIASSSPEPWVAVVEGLVDPAPTLEPVAPLATAFHAEVGGHIYGGMPLPAGTRAVVCAQGTTVRTFGCTFVTSGQANYTLDVAWYGGFTVPIQLSFLWMYVDVNGVPTGIPSGWRQPLTLTHGGTQTFHPTTSDPLTHETLTGSVAIAGGGVPYLAAVSAHVGDGYAMPVHAALATAGDFALAVPQLPAGRFEALAIGRFGDAESMAWRVIDDPAAGADLLVPAPPQLLGPVDGATATAATEFVTVGGPGVARTFTWRPTGGTDGPIVRLTTTRERATMPDLSVVGMAWAAGGSYAWSVAAGAHATVGAAAAEGAVPWAYIVLGGMVHDQDGCFTETEERGVTLAP